MWCRAVQIDMCSMEEVAEIGSRPNSIPISCQLKLNMDGLLERIWEMMALVGAQLPTRGGRGRWRGRGGGVIACGCTNYVASFQRCRAKLMPGVGCGGLVPACAGTPTRARGSSPAQSRQLERRTSAAALRRHMYQRCTSIVCWCVHQ
jgi:hypothetical protein